MKYCSLALSVMLGVVAARPAAAWYDEEPSAQQASGEYSLKLPIPPQTPESEGLALILSKPRLQDDYYGFQRHPGLAVDFADFERRRYGREFEKGQGLVITGAILLPLGVAVATGCGIMAYREKQNQTLPDEEETAHFDAEFFLMIGVGVGIAAAVAGVIILAAGGVKQSRALQVLSFLDSRTGPSSGPSASRFQIAPFSRGAGLSATVSF